MAAATGKSASNNFRYCPLMKFAPATMRSENFSLLFRSFRFCMTSHTVCPSRVIFFSKTSFATVTAVIALGQPE